MATVDRASALAAAAAAAAKPLSLVPPADGEPTTEGEGIVELAKPKKKKKLTKAQKKELKRQREIAFKKLEMQSIFERELKLSRNTAKKIKLTWEDTMKEFKLIELRQELMAWEQKAARNLEEKDEKIQFMLKTISELEQMNQLIAAKLKNMMIHITEVYKALVDGSKNLFEYEAKYAIIDFQTALNENESYQQGWRLHCENIMHTTNLIFEKELQQDYNIFVERRNENVNIAIERRYRIRDAIVKKMKASNQQLLNFVAQLTSTTLDPHKYERIRQLMSRQRAFQIESQRLNELEAKQTRLQYDLQRDLLQSDVRFQRRMNDLRLEQSYFMETRKAIERNIELDRTMTYEKLKVVSSESYIVLKKFEKLRDYGELLLSIAANVRKLQTESEKVIIWGDFAPSELNKAEMDDMRRFALTVINPNTHVDRGNEELFKEMNMMRIFWRRLAIVQTQVAMLTQEKESLLAENRKYQDYIKSFSKVSEPEKLAAALHVQCILPIEFECPHIIRGHKYVTRNSKLK